MRKNCLEPIRFYTIIHNLITTYAFSLALYPLSLKTIFDKWITL